MDLRGRYVTELRRIGGGQVLDLSPSEMGRAACTVLRVDAAGIVMMQRLLRLPVGATDDHARAAERVQATLGDGPCLFASTTGTALAVGETEMSCRWPIYHRKLVQETPFRSSAAFPLKDAEGLVFAGLDLFGTSAHLALTDDLATIQSAVADLIAMLLLRALADEDQLPSWPGGDRLRRRQDVWVAVGMVLEAARVTDSDAMAMMRGYAFSQDLSIDDLAAQMLGGQVATEAVIAG